MNIGTPAAGAGQRRRGLVASLALAGLLAACAQPPAPRLSADPANGAWSGRLSLLVDDASAQSFNAGFELTGRPEQGQLTLLNPLGNVLARLEWSPGRAVLMDGQKQTASDSLDQLVQRLTGSALPVSALFSWLRGDAVQAPGWQADLSALQEHGRLVARRFSPMPEATLRIVLSR